MTALRESSLVNLILDQLLELVIIPRLREHLPGEVPKELLDAMLPEVKRLLQGQRPSWFEVKSLTLALLDDAVRDLREGAE